MARVHGIAIVFMNDCSHNCWSDIRSFPKCFISKKRRNENHLNYLWESLNLSAMIWHVGSPWDYERNPVTKQWVLILFLEISLIILRSPPCFCELNYHDMQYDLSMCGAGSQGWQFVLVCRACIMSIHEYLTMWLDTNPTRLLINQDYSTLTQTVY